MQFTQYFQTVRQRPDRSFIKLEWIQQVIDQPVREVVQDDGRIRRWAPIAEMDGRHLRVVLLPDGSAVHNAFFDRRFKAMNVKYFADTDTLYIELYPAKVDETRDLDEDTLLELDAAGRLCALTIEHASARMDIPAFSYEQIPAGPTAT